LMQRPRSHPRRYPLAPAPARAPARWLVHATARG
jgi:hypothetical protein